MSESETFSAQISCWKLWRFLWEAFDQRLMDLREISANHRLWGTHVLSKWWGAKPLVPAGFPSSPRFKSFKRLSSLPWRSSWWFRLTQRRSLKLSGAHVTECQARRLDWEFEADECKWPQRASLFKGKLNGIVPTGTTAVTLSQNWMNVFPDVFICIMSQLGHNTKDRLSFSKQPMPSHPTVSDTSCV